MVSANVNVKVKPTLSVKGQKLAKGRVQVRVKSKKK